MGYVYGLEPLNLCRFNWHMSLPERVLERTRKVELIQLKLSFYQMVHYIITWTLIWWYWCFLVLGLSLDACIKLKETKKLRTVGEQPSKHRCRRKRKQQAKQKAENTREPVSLAHPEGPQSLICPSQKDETHFFNFLEKTLRSQESIQFSQIWFQISLPTIFLRISSGWCGKKSPSHKINKPKLKCWGNILFTHIERIITLCLIHSSYLNYMNKRKE